MVISHKLKCIFIHIPKSAGTSMDRLLQAADPEVIRILPELPATHVPSKGKHCFAQDLADFLPDFVWSGYFKFAFVRHPAERLVSWYSMCVQKPDVDYRRYVLENTTNFEDFTLKSGAFPGRAAMIGFNQVDYIYGRHHKPLLDFVGRFENIERDFAYVSEQLGLRCPLQQENSSVHGHYREWYSPRSFGVLRNRFERDFAKLGYSLDGVVGAP